MEVIQYLLNGFAVAFSVENMMAVIAGSILGLIVGAMPGIGSLAGVALLLPLTYKFNPTTAMIMLGALYYSNMYGGAFSAILLNVPGDSPAVMTAIDGYKMNAEKKRPGQALLVSNGASCIGGIIGWIILVVTGPMLAEFGLKFGPAEMTALLLVSMTSISWLLGDNPVKGLVITMFGILLACMGMDTLSGAPRYSFGNMYLLGGIPFTPFVIGGIGFAQIINLIVDSRSPNQAEVNTGERLTIRGSMLTKHDYKRLFMPSVRAGFLGTFVGVLPGAGATTAAFLGYAVEKNFKSEEPLGTGAIEGIAACESANNAAAAGAFAPLLALGIPGSGTGAVLLGGLIMFGLNPGPLLFTNEPEFAWGLIASLFISNVVALAISVFTIPWMLKVLALPVKYLIPTITVICVVGAYSTSQSIFGVWVMFLSGIVGYILSRTDYPVAPMLLSFILAPMLESSMRKAFTISGGSLGIFFGSGISSVLMVLLFVLILTPIIKAIIKKVNIKTA